MPALLQPLGYYRSGRPIFPIMGGSEPAGEETPPEDDHGVDAGTANNGDDHQDGGDHFTKPLAEMDAAEQAAYWRSYARKHENKWKTQREQLNAELEQLRQAQMTEQEKAVQAAREEGRQAATADAARSAARAILTANLKARGKEEDQIDDIIAMTNLDAFVNDGDVDTDRVSIYATQFGGNPGSNGTQRLDLGQGRRGNRNQGTGLKAGAALFRERHAATTKE